MTKTQSKNEEGVVIVLFAVFLSLAIPLFAYAVDGYFMLQSRLDQQNTGEYLSLAALSGFYDSENESDFTIRRQEAIDALAEIANDNKIIGLGSNSTSWVFDTENCNNAVCEGSGWRLELGFWNGSEFTTASPIFEEVADSVDPSGVNAIMLELDLQSSSSIAKYFVKANTPDAQIKVSSLTNSYMVGPNRYYRLIRNNAGGSALESQ